jgi:small subunit ribosomal protein S1
MHGIKGFVPLSQLAPIHYPRVEDGDQEAIFEKLLDLIGQELRVRIINIDEEEKRIILSEREALKEERENILKQLEVGKIFDGVVSGVSSYGLFVTIGGTVEGLVHISEITYGHVNNIDNL